MTYHTERDRAGSGQKGQRAVLRTINARADAQGHRPVRIPPGTPGRAFPRLRIERRSYGDEERRCAAEMMAKLRRGEDVRMEKVSQLKEAIEPDDQATIDVIVDRLLEMLSD